MEHIVGQVVCEVCPAVSGAAVTETEEKYSAIRGVFSNRRNVGIVAGIVVALLAAYGIKAGTYSDHFMKNTVINGIDVSGLTAEEAEDLIRAQVEDYSLCITFPDGSKQTVEGGDICLAYSANDQVKDLVGAQMVLGWGVAQLGRSHEYSVDTAYTYDEDALGQVIRSMPAFLDENITESQDAYMSYKEDAVVFEVVPEVEGNRFEEEAVMSKLIASIDDYTQELTLGDEDYIKPAVYSEDEELNAQVAELNEFLGTKITVQLHDGTEYVIAGDTLYGWLSSEGDRYYIDDSVVQAKAVEAAAEIADKDDKVSDSVTFASTKSGTVEVPYKTNGWMVDQEAEAAQIYQDITDRKKVSRKPSYSREDGIVIGDTYVEVDIRNQEVFVYVDGEVVVDANCVSGTDTVADRRSDRGLFYIYKKLKNHTMLGPIDPKTKKPSYSSPTNFATYYNGGEAFHDASWRSRFGGNTYVYSGSHGCINMSYSSAKAVYENTEIGMPVLVFGSTQH